MHPESNRHDLRLPDWGPYTKKYIGISHIASQQQGVRFDLSVFPGFYRRKVGVPSVMWESDYHPWEAAPDLSYYTHRHELEWKDRVYSDISFVRMDANRNLIRCDLVNNTDTKQNVVLHYMASVHFPAVKAHGDPMELIEVQGLGGAVWVDALDYEELEFAVKRPDDHLVYDGFYRGEERVSGFVNASGLGKGFGKNKGDRVKYKVRVPGAIQDAVLVIRYQMESGGKLELAMEGLAVASIQLAGSTGMNSCRMALGSIGPGEYELELVSSGGTPLILDGLLIAEQERHEQIQFRAVGWEPRPDKQPGPVPNSLILSYKNCDQVYGMVWLFDNYEIREYHGKDLDLSLRHNVHHHVHSSFYSPGQGHYTNVYMRPIALEGETSKRLYGMVCHGAIDEVKAFLQAFASRENDATCETRYLESKSSSAIQPVNPSGEKYLFGLQRLAATTLTNVVFPVYTKRSFIKHYTPGRWWDSLYTWDSGFIGLGLAELSIDRAIDSLQTYLTEPGDPQAAFMHHGSMVPVQHYQFLEIWNKTQSLELLQSYYASLKQYYQFYCGHHEGSTMKPFQSNLLNPWDYFYNSGGWDDYPPQVHVHRSGLKKQVAPVINTAHGIRIAKILKMAAKELGLLEDVELYDQDIELLSQALQQHAWDESAGFYGYVCHNEQGEPEGILQYNNEVNYNMGLDGAYPLVAGICDARQTELLLGHLFDEEEIWSPIGLSAVSQKAPYYNIEGYWNGTVWMPHQWFFWKTMIDLGRLDLAYQIAETGLEVWEREVRESYNCFEHFIIKTGRGAGWHHFGGLSNPVLSWFNAYHRPGTLTCGFDVWMKLTEVQPDHTQLTATLQYEGGRETFSLIATMSPECRYEALWNGEQAAIISKGDGVLHLELTAPAKQNEPGQLIIRAV
ncbi:MGH1-like glycoside hydrolase domain-containing protein [Paenibacillus cremeus]|uniref:Mannosylglycerate hydrolase MGH1-like glycoside hydrolase domain-containing protein n=1 Tax=Paenibacillus cremeus TaxID=2163881 RepID=A0A559KHY3_9BACL|nr:trehalase family glycosidase [Paenibacillus cremeus]TVY11747.1 hypothetical protein FPZ49_00170 [Paenibacillus cremeus]